MPPRYEGKPTPLPCGLGHVRENWAIYAGLGLVAVISGWLLWKLRKTGAVLNLGILPMEAVFWIGFALPIPWLFGIARVALVCLAWPELSGSRPTAIAATRRRSRPSR